MPPVCPYCGGVAEFIKDTTELYKKNYGSVWICRPCQAWVGCHEGSRKPLGGLANKELRWLRAEAHKAFDPLWQDKMSRDGCSKQSARTLGYAWLASKLDVPIRECHIGMFNLEQCLAAIEVCSVYSK